jgi:hypothetical protein
MQCVKLGTDFSRSRPGYVLSLNISFAAVSSLTTFIDINIFASHSLLNGSVFNAFSLPHPYASGNTGFLFHHRLFSA